MRRLLMTVLKRIRGKATLSLARLAISGLSITFFRSFPKLQKHSVDTISTQNLILKSDNQIFFKLYENWRHSFDLHNDGLYYDAVDLRKHTLSTIYRLAGCDDESYYPPILTHGFATGIGHQTNLLLHTAAHDLGLIPQGPRFLIINPKVEHTPLLRVALAKYMELPSLEPSWGNNPLVWNQLEQNELLRGKGEFIDQYDFYQRVFSEWRVRGGTKPLIQLPESYLQETRDFLLSFGIESTSGYIAIHVRENNSLYDPRNVSVENYVTLTKELLSRGYTVVRFGVGKMTPFPPTEGLLDLSIFNDETHSKYHPGIIALCKAFIVTLSGPLSLGYLFNVPTLATNVVATSLNALFTTNKSLYLPKHIFSKATKSNLPLDEVLSSPLGYGLMSRKMMESKGLGYIENSTSELISAFDELLELGRARRSVSEIGEIQKSANTVGRGLISRLAN